VVHVVTTGIEIFKTRVWMDGRRERMNNQLIACNELRSYLFRQHQSHFLPSMRRIWTYSRITSRKSLSFCVTSFSTSLTNPTTLLPKHDDCVCYVNRWILAPPQFWLQEDTDDHDLAHSTVLWQQSRVCNITCA